MEADITAVPNSEEVPTGSRYDDEPLNITDNNKLPPKESEVQISGEVAEVADESMQNPLPTGQPLFERVDDGPLPREQYIPLVELMQPLPKPAPERPPPLAKPRKATKGRKAKGCYHQLAEDLAVELQAINEKLVNQKLHNLEVSQVTELGDVQEPPRLEEDSYVFVSQQGDNWELINSFNIFV